ncbi:MAG: 3'-5' exoribonuclease YhaM family protein [Bacilli bacterium]
MMIKDFKDGLAIKQNFLVTQINKGVTASGQPYLTIILQDKTGQIEGKFWDIKPEMESLIEVGAFLLVDGDVSAYRQVLQVRINQVQRLNPDTIRLEDYTISAPVPLKQLAEELKVAIARITDPDYLKLTQTLIEQHYDAFLTYPAAVRNHHEYTSGLIYHTLSMIKVAVALIPLYPKINSSLVYAGILLHDLGKTVEFTGAVIPKYSTEGKLIGHLQWMAGKIQSQGETLNINREKVMLLQHLVLSHHGKPEFGSAVMPLTKEALFVSMVDDFDAKMTIVDKALDATEPGQFTNRIFALDDRSFFKPKS